MMCAVALTMLVVGCTNNDAATTGDATGADITDNDSGEGVAPSTDLGSRLKIGDTTICTDPQVERTALATIVGPSVLQDFEQNGGRLGPFDTVSAIGVNKDVGQIACSANLKFNGASTNAFEYDVRPALDPGGGIVVETKMSYGDREAVSKYIEIVQEGKRLREQQRMITAVGSQANNSDSQGTPEQDTPRTGGVVDENGHPVTVSFAHKFWGLRVISLANPGTDHAILTARMSAEGAREYCERNPFGDTGSYGGIHQCVRKLRAREGLKTYTFRANCPRRMIFDGERWYRQTPLNEAGEMHWQDMKSKETLDASGATNHDAHDEQLEILCPSAQTSPY